MEKIQVKPTVLDKAIGFFSPRALNARMSARIKYAMAQQVGYVYPGSPKKTMKGVVASANSPDHDMVPKLKGSRALSRDMFMNSPLAVAALRRARTNIVGSGLVPKPIVDREFLGVSEDQAVQMESNMLREFMAWADSANSDFHRRQNFWDSQATVFLSTFLNGDTFFMLPWKRPPRSGNWPYELRVKLIEADLVRNPETVPEHLQNKILSGIRYGKDHEIYSAFFHKYYPNDSYNYSNSFTDEYREIRKYAPSGRQNWFQLYEPERIGQRRGMPILAAILDPLKSVSRLSDSELTGALVASMFTVFVKDQNAMGGTINTPFTPPETVGAGGTVTDSEGNQVKVPNDPQDGQDLELGPGLIHYLDNDKDITIADPKRPNGAFEPFFNSLVTTIAAAIEIPAEVLLLKFNTSYSAARAAILEAWKFWRRRRTWLVREYCQPIYEEFITEAVIKGRLNCPGFFDDIIIKKAWTNVLWAGPGMGQIDPLKEARAAVLKIGANLSNHQVEHMADKGGHWDSMIEQKSREKKKLESLGLEANLKPKELSGPDGVEDDEEKDEPTNTDPKDE